MRIVKEFFESVKLIEPFVHRDPRGDFVKPYHEEQLTAIGISLSVKEEFFSSSAAGVVRGFHFQIPPNEHNKLIYCIRGKVLDVFMDIRKGSSTYGQCVGVEISEENHYIVLIPKGFAHAFASLEDDSCLVYKTDAVYAPESDQGILWSSVDFDWPFDSPITSERDNGFQPLKAFVSPFEL